MPLKKMSPDASTLTKQKKSREFLYQKLRYKRNVTFGIFAIGFAYLMLSAERSMSSVSAQDTLDVNPKPPSPYSTQWKSLTSTAESLRSQESSQYAQNVTEGSYDGDLTVGVNCTPPAIHDFPPDLFTQSERRQGGVAVHFFISLYIFYAIALVCDDYFVPSIESICEALRIPPDVAGATFMAIATSSPELFTNIIGTFVTQGDLGVGTIVGSAVFNIMAVSACCGLTATQILQLEWWALTRDCFFYSLSVILLITILDNRKVFWYEALILVIFYGLYIFVMYHNNACKHFAERMLYGVTGRAKRRRVSSITHKSQEKQFYGNDKNISFHDAFGIDEEKTPLIREALTSPYNGNAVVAHDAYSSSENDGDFDDPSSVRNEMLIAKALHQTEVEVEDEKKDWGLFKFPFGESWLKWLEWTVGWPAQFIFVLTVPDCREHRFRKWYPLTFFMCIIWIAILTYVISWMMTVIGYTFAIPDSVMGLTFIAAGTSVPEAVSSIIVSRQGLGSMGISNSIGSNTFDILICLGLPWLVRTSIISNSPTDFIQINSGGLEYATIILIVTIVLLYVLLACNRFVLDKKIGIMALTMYALFLVISSLVELNVFFNINLPICAE